MAFQPNTASVGTAARKPSAGGVSASIASQKATKAAATGAKSPPTHSVTLEDSKTYLNSMIAWENPNNFGKTSLKLRVTETIPAGTKLKVYPRKDTVSEFIREGGAYTVRSNNDYYNNLGITVGKGKFSHYLDLELKTDLQPGDYFVNERKSSTND